MSLIAPSTLFTQSWGLFTKHWKPLLKMNLWVLIPLAFYLVSAWLSMRVDSKFWPLTILCYLALIVVGTWTQARTLRASLHFVDGKPLEADESSRALHLAPSLFVWSILWALPLIPLAFLFLIPAIWLGVCWSFGSYRLVEGKKPYARGSAKLVQGRWFPIFGRQLLGGLLLMGASLCISMATSIVFGAIGLIASVAFNVSTTLATAGGPSTYFWVSEGLRMLISFGAGLFLGIYLLMYQTALYRSVEKTAATSTPAS